MLTRADLRRQDGSAIVTALMVMLIMLPIGMALMSIVDTQAKQSAGERSRDLAFNLADSALTSAAFNLGRFAWPASGISAPSNTSATGVAGVCATSSYGAALGGPTVAGSATSKLQPNLNASYDDKAYRGATWQINVCDDDPLAAGPKIWKEDLLARQNYDANGNRLVWVRSEARVDGHRRVLAALVRAVPTPALSSKFGLITGRMNADVTNAVGQVLTGNLLNDVTEALFTTAPLVAPDPPATTPPSSGVIGLRCGALDGCLTGTLAALDSLALFSTLVTGGKLVQATSPTAASAASIAQLKQQAINSGTYVASVAGTDSSSNPPACAIPAGADSSTVVYIENVGTTGVTHALHGPGDQFCELDVSGDKAYKALIIGSGRVVLRGSNRSNGGTFTGLVYALNEQRAWLGDDALPTREVVRIDKGAHVRGGVAADGKSAQVGIYPPPPDPFTCTFNILDPLECVTRLLGATLGYVSSYNPAIRSDVSVMNAVSVFDGTALVTGTYRDIAGEAS